MPEGILRIREVKKGKEYKVEYTDEKGKTRSMVIHPENRCFDEAKVKEDDPVVFEIDGAKAINCKVTGKEAAPPQPERKEVMRQTGGARPGAGYSGAGRSGSAPGKALCDAVAPYNFIPFDAKTVIPALEDGPGKWSGKIVCSLSALTPLLVSGPQTKAGDDAPSECRFMRINGENIIPGSSIKGMLRSLLEILSFSNMTPVTDKKLFYRRVNRPDYRADFPQDVLGGFLRKRGANYFIVPVTVVPKDVNEKPGDGIEKVRTGGFSKNGKESKAYFFHHPGKNDHEEPLDREIVNAFWEQLTPNQEKRWPRQKREDLLKRYPGLPVFYRRDADNKIAELGFCRYFRRQYKYSPFDLAYPDGQKVKQDFAARLFGMVGEDSSKGRVSVQAAPVTGKLLNENGVAVVLGGPKPTCLALYLDQNPATVKTISHGTKNDPDSFMSYNDRSAGLRGRKLYWHHDADSKFFPRPDEGGKNSSKANSKVLSRLYPLAEGGSAKFEIYIDRLTDLELGGLLEAIQLPKGHAHKLGMGKSLGFGSVRLEIESAEIRDSRELHKSLAARLAGEASLCLDISELDELREKFRARILAEARKLEPKWKNIGDYDDLPPIRILRLMMDYERRPAPQDVRTMALRYNRDDSLTKINFSLNAILPKPEEVAKGIGRK